MTIPTEVFLAVLGAALLHAIWNAMAKGAGGDPLLASAAIGLGAAAVALPALAVVGLPAAGSTPYVVASAIIHVAYFLMIGLAFRAADYAVIYPLYRGTAPLGTALIGTSVAGEMLELKTWGGIAVLCLGLLALGLDAMRRQGLTLQALGLGGAIALVIVAYTLVDGLGARASGNAPGYVCAMLVLTGVLLLPVLYDRLGPTMLSQAAGRTGYALLGGGLVLVSYGTALWAMTMAPIGVVAALRETSVLFATLIAAVLLRERVGPVRWLAAGLIVAGLVLIRLA